MLEMKCEFDKAATALASNRGLKALNPLEKSRLSFFFFSIKGEKTFFFFFSLHWHRMKFLQQLPGDNGLKLNSPISFSNYRTFLFFQTIEYQANNNQAGIRQSHTGYLGYESPYSQQSSFYFLLLVRHAESYADGERH